MMIEIPDNEAAARRGQQVKYGDTLDECRKNHDMAVDEDGLSNAADWSYLIALLEWSPPRAFKVGDVVQRGDVLTTDDAVVRTVKGVDGDYINFGASFQWVPAANYVLVKAVDS